MKPLKHILVPTDFSDCAFNAMRFALQFSDKYNADITIHLMHVVFPEVEPVDFPTFSDNATKQKVEWAQENLKRFSETTMAQVQANGPLRNVPNIQSTVEIGTNPSALISRISKRDNMDLGYYGHSRRE